MLASFCVQSFLCTSWHMSLASNWDGFLLSFSSVKTIDFFLDSLLCCMDGQFQFVSILWIMTVVSKVFGSFLISVLVYFLWPGKKVKVLLLYSAARPDGFSSALQPYPWQGTHPTLVWAITLRWSEQIGSLHSMQG